MLCGVKFCGGCNPRYDRVRAFERLQSRFEAEGAGGSDEASGIGHAERPEFQFAKEGVLYDALLVIGGCPACCASCSQYDVEGAVVKMWGEDQLDEAASRLKKIL